MIKIVLIIDQRIFQNSFICINFYIRIIALFQDMENIR